MSESMRWSLPLIATGQAQKEITHNEAIVAIDLLLQLAVVSRNQSAPPGAAIAGDIHIVGPSPTGPWAGHEAKLASFDGTQWSFTAPRAGCLAWICDTQVFTVWTQSGWSRLGLPPAEIGASERLQLASEAMDVAQGTGGSVVDAECRAVLSALLGVLRSQGVIA